MNGLNVTNGNFMCLLQNKRKLDESKGNLRTYLQAMFSFLIPSTTKMVLRPSKGLLVPVLETGQLLGTSGRWEVDVPEGSADLSCWSFPTLEIFIKPAKKSTFFIL